jgi:hypothetical protein
MRFLILLLCCLSGRSEAETLEIDSFPFAVNASNHTLFTNTQNLENENQSPSLLRSETHLRGESGRFSLGVIAANRLAVALRDGSDVPLVLEKKFLSFESDEWQVTLGDSHHELGRGIALALFRDETFGIDYTVEGASVRYAPEGWESKIFAGRARTLAAPVALIPFQDPLFGRQLYLGHLGVKRTWASTQLSAHYLLTLNQANDATDFDKRWHTAGMTFSSDGFAPGWDVYAESNVMLGQRLLPQSQDLPTAWGSYASVVYAPLPWKFKLEARDYRNYAYDFHRPPTMEEDIVTSLNFTNITAARFWAERRLGVYNRVRASILSGEDRVVRTNVHHAVLSGLWKVGEVSFESRAGFRVMETQSDLVHGDVRAKIPTFAGQVLELGYRKLRGRSNLQTFATLDDRNFFDLAYTFSSHWSMTAGMEYVPSNPVATGQQFYNVGAVAKYDSFTSRAFVGSTSGGPQCSGGICRLVPPYSGLMVEGTVSF